MFEKRGVDVVAMFDVSKNSVGKKINNVRVYHMDDFEKIIEEFQVDIVILTLPKDKAVDAAERIRKSSIKGIWNFTGQELDMAKEGIAVENVHIGDSLMTLCYEISKSDKK